jgi:hypothetical protein
LARELRLSGGYFVEDIARRFLTGRARGAGQADNWARNFSCDNGKALALDPTRFEFAAAL